MCDVVGALAPVTAEGATIWAKNSDRPPSETQVLEWLAPHRDEPTVRATHIEIEGARAGTIGVVGSRPAWGWGLEHGVNQAGVAVGNLSVFTTLDPRTFPPALTGMDLVRLALERGSSAREAIAVIGDAIDRYGQGGSGHHLAAHPYWSSFVVSDAEAIWVVDTSGPTWTAEGVGPTWASSNRTALPAFDAMHRHPRQPVGRLVEPRLAASWAMLNRAPVSVEAVVSHLRSHEGHDGYSPCMHAGAEQETTASMVVTLPRGRSPMVRCVIGSPCSSIFVPLAIGPIGLPPQRWPLPGPSTVGEREVLDQAEAQLTEMVGADPDLVDSPKWPATAWSIALGAAEELADRR